MNTVDGFVWVAEEGRGHPYIAVPMDNMSSEMKDSNKWRRWDLTDLPGAMARGDVADSLKWHQEKFGTYAIAKCSEVGLSAGLDTIFGPSVWAAYDGVPSPVSLPLDPQQKITW